MKLLQVVGSMDPVNGGICQAVRTLAPELNQLGIYTEVVTLDEPTSNYIGSDNFPIHTVGNGKGLWWYNPKLTVWLLENISKFDIIIIHGLWLYPSFAAWKVIKRIRENPKNAIKAPKLYVMPHGMLDPWFQKAKGRKLKAFRNWIYWFLIEKNVVNEADGLLFTCQTELLLAQKTFKDYHPKQEINVGYGIDAPPELNVEINRVFQELPFFLNERPYLLFMGRIHIKKGIDLLVKAYLSLKSKGVSLPVLVIAGPGLETKFGQKVAALASKDKDIIFTGMLTGYAKWGLLYNCEAFILPSHQENFGIAVVEALACSKPVLISNQVNIWREIESGKGGIIGNNSLEGVQRMLLKWSELDINSKSIMGKQALTVYHESFSVYPAAKRLQSAISK